jgi:heavy metal sensor kinase
MSRLSLRVRLTLWYALALLVVLSVFGADLWWTEGRLGLQRVDRDLDELTATVTNVVQAELKEGGSPVAAAEEATRTVASRASAVAIRDARGALLAASDAGAALPVPSPGQAAWTARMRRGAWRIHARSVTLDRTPLLVVVAHPLADAERGQREVLEAIEIALPLALLLASLGGFWLASIGLRPITDMAARAGQIQASGLQDLGDTGRADELGQLARAFNGLIARLRGALDGQRQFMADASHELRTPVSVVRAAADVALSRERRDESEYRDTLAIVGDEARRLSRLVENMLVLARADAGGYPLRRVDLYLDEVVMDCCRALKPLSTERQVAIRTGTWPEVPFRGDEDLLRQLVMNVLQNAVQHSSTPGSVAVDVTRSTTGVTIRITDSGTGIPSADRPRIFDRFVQLDHARRGTGAGLGLPIARWIAEAHGGSLMLGSSGPDGSTFSIELPAAGSHGVTVQAFRPAAAGRGSGPPGAA